MHPFLCHPVCPCVRTLTTFLFLDRIGQQRYLWIPYTKAEVLRQLWCISEPKKKFQRQFSFFSKTSDCLNISGLLSICAHTNYSCILCSIWPKKISIDSSRKDESFKSILGHIRAIEKNHRWSSIFPTSVCQNMHPFLCHPVCPSVCLSVCAHANYFFIFGQNRPAKVYLDSLH